MHTIFILNVFIFDVHSCSFKIQNNLSLITQTISDTVSDAVCARHIQVTTLLGLSVPSAVVCNFLLKV